MCYFTYLRIVVNLKNNQQPGLQVDVLTKCYLTGSQRVVNLKIIDNQACWLTYFSQQRTAQNTYKLEDQS